MGLNLCCAPPIPASNRNILWLNSDRVYYGCLRANRPVSAATLNSNVYFLTLRPASAGLHTDLNTAPAIPIPSQLRAILAPFERAPIGSPQIALPNRNLSSLRLHPLARVAGVPPDADTTHEQLYLPNPQPRLWMELLLIEPGRIRAQAQTRTRRPTEVARSSTLLSMTATRSTTHRPSSEGMEASSLPESEETMDGSVMDVPNRRFSQPTTRALPEPILSGFHLLRVYALAF